MRHAKLHNNMVFGATAQIRRRGMLVEAADVLNDGNVRLMFSDGATGQYHPTWLRLNCTTNSWATWNRLTPMDLNDEQVQLADVQCVVAGSTTWML